MAQIDIGKLTFTHKGDYAGGTAYVANDVVYYNGSAYIAKTSTTGNLPTSTAHWNTFAAGSGGIWNAGLSLGSANQLLRVNSGASALEFHTPATVTSDMVKITTQTLGSDTTTWSLDNYFSSDYRHYRYFCDKFRTSHDGGWTRCRLNESAGTQYTGSDYSKFQSSIYVSSSSYASDNSSDAFTPIQNSTTTAKTGSFEMTIYDPQDTRYTAIIGQGAGFDGGTNGFGSSFMVVLKRTNAITGITFTDNNGNTLYAGARVTIYGVKA